MRGNFNFISAALIVCLLLTGCAGQSEEGEPASSASTPPAPTPAPTETSEPGPTETAAAPASAEPDATELPESDREEAAMDTPRKRALPEGFVYVDEIVPTVQLDIRYYSDFNFVGEPIDGYRAPLAILTEEAAAALQSASRALEEQGYGFKIFDAYRPARAVAHFIRWSKSGREDEEMKAVFYPEIDKKDLFRQGYLASRSGHSRGSTVDLTLYRLESGEEVDMGGPFDYLDKLSHHEAGGLSEEQRKHRRLLREAMEQAGFRAYSKEWWHYTLADEPYPDQYFDFEVE